MRIKGLYSLDTSFCKTKVSQSFTDFDFIFLKSGAFKDGCVYVVQKSDSVMILGN